MKSIITAVLCASALCGCAGMSDTEQRALTGTTGGAAAGAVLGAIGGNAGLGAVAGAGAGLAGGLLYDRSKKAQETAYQQGYADARQRSAAR